MEALGGHVPGSDGGTASGGAGSLAGGASSGEEVDEAHRCRGDPGEVVSGGAGNGRSEQQNLGGSTPDDGGRWGGVDLEARGLDRFAVGIRVDAREVHSVLAVGADTRPRPQVGAVR